MQVGIDTSHQLTYTGIISGYPSEMESLFSKMEKVFHDNGVAGKFHWCKLSNKTKDKMKRQLADALLKSKRVNLNVLYHPRPRDTQKKEWFLRYVPASIARKLEKWLVGKDGRVGIAIDDDYAVVKGGEGTRHFIEALLRQLSNRLAGTDAKIRPEEEIKMTIKQSNGNHLTFYASVAGKENKLISLVDVYLGLYLYDKDALTGLPNVHYDEMK